MSTIGECTIHNIRAERMVTANLKLYCGRDTRMGTDRMIYADLGNPFHMRTTGRLERERVCDEYEQLLASAPNHPHWPRIRRIGQRLAEGKSVALFCYCSPLRCHCDTIRKHAVNHATNLIQS